MGQGTPSGTLLVMPRAARQINWRIVKKTAVIYDVWNVRKYFLICTSASKRACLVSIIRTKNTNTGMLPQFYFYIRVVAESW